MPSRKQALWIVCTLTNALAQDVQQAQKPVPFIGYTLSFTGRVLGVDCAEWRLSENQENGDLVSTCEGYRLEISGAEDLNPRKVIDSTGKTIVEFKPYAPGLKFPLEVGTKWQAPYVAFTAYNGLVWDGAAECESKAYETVTVKAGSFDAFRIECRDKWQIGSATGYTHSTRWYAPEVAGVVKSIHREDPERWNFELVRYGLDETPSSANRMQSAPAATGSFPGEAGLPPILDPEDY
ncbi:MAG: hypothetical protein ACREXT_08655 [Gammaproteobacteria bacterium]